MKTEAIEVSSSVPIRRTRWTSFWIGAVAFIVTLLLAAGLSALLLLSHHAGYIAGIALLVDGVAAQI